MAPTPTLTLDRDLASNVYVNDGKPTYHVCTGCLQAFAGGQFECLGQPGCIFFPKSTANLKIFASRVRKIPGSDEEVFTPECARCFLHGKPCNAPPADLDINWDTLFANILRFRNGIQTSAPVEATATTEAIPAVYRDMTADEAKLTRADIMDMLRGIPKLFSSTYSPASTHLQLHNGNRRSGESPYSGIRPPISSQSKVAREIKAKAQEEAVVKGVQKEAALYDPASGTPKKRRLNEAPTEEGFQVQIDTLEGELNTLVEERVGLTGAAKKAKTTEINKRKSRITMLRKKMA